ncbi:hypothetical protein V8E36_004368 [Tilletia maclaganii]
MLPKKQHRRQLQLQHQPNLKQHLRLRVKRSSGSTVAAAAPAPAPGPATGPAAGSAPAGTAATDASASARPARRSTRPSSYAEDDDDIISISSRPQRAAAAKAPRLKVKMSKGDQGSAPKNAAYMQGYNRELDSSDDEGEGLAFEEQIIFRMSAGPDCDKLRDMVKNKEVGDSGAAEVSLEFKDSRRAIFKFGNSRYSAKLVDLPTITESHKILDNKQLFKVADISQMLLVEEKLRDSDAAANGDPGSASSGHAGSSLDKAFDIDDFIYPHGITPPMHWARKRRFRKRANKRNIETVEKEVERLIEEDELAEKVEFELIDENIADHSDSEMGDNATSIAAATPRPMSDDGESQVGDQGDESLLDRGDRTANADEDEEPEEDEVDEDLAAALDAALEEAEEEESDSDGENADAERDGERDGPAAEDEDDADEEEEDDDEDEEQAEQRIRVNQLEAECREIDTLVKRKQADVDRAANPMIKQRLERSLKALQVELDSKRAQLLALRQEREHRKEEAAQAEAEAEEERNRQVEETEKEALAREEEAAIKGGGGDVADTHSQEQQPDDPAQSPAASTRRTQQGKSTGGRVSTLKDVLIGEGSRNAASLTAPQRHSSSTPAAASPAPLPVPMEIDEPKEPQLTAGRGLEEAEEAEADEGEEDEDPEEDGDAGAAPNEDSDAEENEDIWS